VKFVVIVRTVVLELKKVPGNFALIVELLQITSTK
jgi:hypothetical protein